ncbi:MAG TPA: CBS domain-containing protein [Acidimicrobiia bacterium]|nr:CBS domain-containing protein [Acidimicrobiia bacterium]
MEIRDLVVRDLVTVGPAHTLAQAAKLMSAKRVGSAIVLTDESPGILSERDVLRAVADGADPATAVVGDYMTWNAIVATSEWEVMEAARTMLEHGFRHLVVIDGSSAAEIGILSIRDLMAGILGCNRPDRSSLAGIAGEGY